MVSKVLLHICCAPCLIYPLRSLRERGYEVGGFFYNPNIHPSAEYAARRDALTAYAAAAGLALDVPGYRPQDFCFESKSCAQCWALRLRATAREAARRGYVSFSTTLLVSPYQDHEALRRIGEAAAGEEGVAFYYDDFRPGFRAAQAEAKAAGMYRQTYCGCRYSELKRSAGPAPRPAAGAGVR